MATRDPRIDAYIAKSPDFAQPILRHLRELAHAACPAIEETMKWSRPHFLHHGMVFGMSAFKEYCSVGFWKGELLFGRPPGGSAEGMGHFGRIKTLSDLPQDRVMMGYIKKAAQLNKDGVQPPPRPRAPKMELVVPDYLQVALAKKPKARAAFEAFSYSHKKEYLEWITEAKREETRAKRIGTMLTWLTEGKSRNWKYENC